MVVVGSFFLLTGCGSGSQTVDPQYMKGQADLGKDIKTMFDRTKGDYSQLTASEKDEYVKSFGNNEKAAQAFWDKMKSGKPMDSRAGLPTKG